MDTIVPEFKQLLRDWAFAADALGHSIEQREYDQFEKTYSEGDRIFKKITALLPKLTDSQKQELQEPAVAAAQRWTEAVQNVPEWREEILAEVTSVKHRKTAVGKISKAYDSIGRQKTGINLYIRAK